MQRLTRATTAPRSHLSLALFLLALAGCSGSGPSTPAAPTEGPAALGSGIAPSGLDGRVLISEEQGQLESIVGGYTLRLEGDPLTARVEPWRSNAGIQGKLYDLDIENFLAGDTFRITGLRFDPDLNVIVDYTITHPFGAPDLSGAVTALNRADLGFTGRVMFLADVPTGQVAQRTFFGSVVANTDTVLNADHYFDPGDLLAAGTGFNATAFPSKLVVDEAIGGVGNRVGISNGGNPEGNFNSVPGGWQRGNIGPGNNGWTGYDYLHGGQAARNSVVISRDTMESGGASVNFAIFIKYTDPRGVPFPQNRDVRFPANPTDTSIFAYRAVNGALDASQMLFTGLTNNRLEIGGTGGSTADFTVRMRDWDAAATETVETEISDDPDVTTVNIGTSGASQVELSVPALDTNPYLLVVGGGTGLPGDELSYDAQITNALGTAPAGSTQYLLVRATDPENGVNRSTFHFGVDPVSLTGDPARATDVITYQALPITVLSANSAPECGGLAINGGGNIGVGGTFTMDLTGVVDADGDDLTFSFAYTGPGNSSSGNVTLTDAERALESAFNPFTDPRVAPGLVAPLTPGDYSLSVTIADAETDVVCTLPFTVTATFAPECNLLTVNEPNPLPSPATFTMDLSSVSDVDSLAADFTFNYIGPTNDTTSPINFVIGDLGSEPAFNPFTDPRLLDTLDPMISAGFYSVFVTIDDGDTATSCGPFNVQVTSTTQPPGCGTFAINEPSTIPPGGTFTLDLSTIDDPDSTTVDMSFSFVGPESGSTDTITFVVGTLPLETAFDPFTDLRLATPLLSPLTDGSYVFSLNMTDDQGNPTVCLDAFTVESAPNRPPECGAGIVLSQSSFTEGDLIDFNIDMSAITDPDGFLAAVTVSYTGPESSTTSTETVPYPLPVSLNPFDDPGFGTNLARPATVGPYVCAVTVEDELGESVVCTAPFTILPVGGGSPVTDIDVVFNRVDMNGGKSVPETDMLTITWDENDAPEYAIYADLDPIQDPDLADFPNYNPDAPEFNDDFELIGTTNTNSFTGVDLDILKGFFIAHIVVRARTEAGNPGSELADSESAFVGLMHRPDVPLSVEPFWVMTINNAGMTFGLLLSSDEELDGNPYVQIDECPSPGAGALMSVNMPVPMIGTIDNAYIAGNINVHNLDAALADMYWDSAENQGHAGLTYIPPDFADLIWSPIRAGEAYNATQADLGDFLSGVPGAGNTVHQYASGTDNWHYFEIDAVDRIGDDGGIGTMFYTFSGVLESDENPGWDDTGWVYD